MLQTMLDVIKYVLIILVHINAAVIKDISQVGNAAKVRFICPEEEMLLRETYHSLVSLSPALSSPN